MKDTLMREIKFRMWDSANKEMYSVDELSSLWDIGIPVAIHQSIADKRDLRLRVDENPLMQYTGLHDKNGKEIYEGDILKEPDFDGYVEVRWSRGTQGYTPYVAEEGTEWTIVGNIYENPDLLQPDK